MNKFLFENKKSTKIVESQTAVLMHLLKTIQGRSSLVLFDLVNLNDKLLELSETTLW